MYLSWCTLLCFAVFVSAGSNPCDLPSLTEVGSQYYILGADCRQYAYGYNAGSSAKVELKDATGTVVGAYHYIDANNVTQKVNYTANDVDGFVVSASNLPDTLEDMEVEKTHAEVVAAEEQTLSKLSLGQHDVPALPHDEQILFKPIISVWYPASPYSHDHILVQHAEESPQKQKDSDY